MKTPTFALIGAAGFVAPRHLEAIKAVNGTLIAALDPHDSVGILDRYGKDIAFFTEPERFERFLHKHPVDYLSVCSPNYLHDAHVRMGLQAGCNVICEKPLALNPENLDAMLEMESKTGKRVFTVLQLRLNPQVQALKKWIEKEPGISADLRYVTPRGAWYQHSWKGDPEKSGGLLTNIGVHMFDLLLFLFGENPTVHHTQDEHSASGTLLYPGREIPFYLSIDSHAVPERALTVTHNHGRERLDLSEGFQEAHVKVYEHILACHGFSIENARPAIDLCWRLRSE